MSTALRRTARRYLQAYGGGPLRWRYPLPDRRELAQSMLWREGGVADRRRRECLREGVGARYGERRGSRGKSVGVTQKSGLKSLK